MREQSSQIGMGCRLRGCLRKLVSSVFLAVMVLSTPYIAHAEESQSQMGSVTITPMQGNEGVTYNAYCLFLADVDSAGQVANVAWPNPQVQAFVEGFLAEMDPAYAGVTPVDAANYISAQLAGADGSQVLEEGSFGALLAATVDDLASVAVLTPGEQQSLAEGYYLFVATPATLTGSTMGTSPIFAVINQDEPLTITEKASLPTLTKQVKDDEAGSQYGAVADAAQGQDLDYRLIGTLPENYAAFGMYHYCFTDVFPAGMALGTRQDGTYDVSVAIDGTDVTDLLVGGSGSIQYSEGSATSVLTVNIANLNALGLDVTKDSSVTVDYRAHLTARAVVGMPGNVNSATLAYSNNPSDMSEGTSEPANTTTYTYALRVVKQDAEAKSDGTHTPLPNASFTLQRLDTNAYLQTDGSWANQPASLTTDSDGIVTASRLADGKYRLVEVAAPAGYGKLTAPIDVTVTGHPAADQQELILRVSAHQGVATGDAEWATGTVVVTVNNQAGVELPITGGSGVGVVYMCGLCLIVAALLLAIARQCPASRHSKQHG